MNLRAFIFTAVAALVAVKADVNKINHDQVQSFAQLEPTTNSEKSAIKYKPQLRISTGCQPYPAVDAKGAVSGGLKWGGPADGKCKGSGLGSQVYSRSDWYKDKWAIMYAWYFPKGLRQISKYEDGHRHYWSYVVVWTDSDVPDKSTILGVSMSAGKEAPPKSKYVVDGTTVKFQSFKNFWGSSQGIQLTTKTGVTQDLITWEQLTAEARTGLTNADFDTDSSYKKVVMPMSDEAFKDALKNQYPF